MSRRILRRSDFPAIDALLAGYLNQDVHDIHGSVDAALETFLADARVRDREALAREWALFLTLTDGMSAAGRLALFVRSFGAGWTPKRFAHVAAIFDRLLPRPRR
jgi:hypothetical protein